MNKTLPSDLLRWWHEGTLRPTCPVSVDTETSGLHVDSGARISTVSVAWEDDEQSNGFRAAFGSETGPALDGMVPYQETSESHIQTWAIEKIDHWDEVPIISFAWPFDQGVAGTGKPEDSGQGELWDDTVNLPESEFQALLDWLVLVGNDVGLTMHHAKFDCHQFDHGVRRWPDTHIDLMDFVTWDTQNVADILTGRKIIRMQNGEPRPVTSLKPTASHLWGEHESDEQQVIQKYLKQHGLPAGRWDLMPWDVIARYADQDARLTARLRIWQETNAVRDASISGWFDGQKGRMTVHEAIERRLFVSKMLYRVERRGLPFAVDQAFDASTLIREKIALLEKQLPFKPATINTAKHYFFGEGTVKGVTGQGRTPFGLTETGGVQMDAAIVQKMVNLEIPYADVWRDIQKLQTVDDKWYTGWAVRAGDDDRLRISFKQNGTVSGRFSAEGLQLHAIPHDYKLQNFEILNDIPSPRDLIGAGVPEGWKMWELDLANAELRVAALFADCRRMLDLIFSGADLHADAATELFKFTADDPEFGEYRQVAKRFNFAAIFGVGKDTLQGDVEQQTGIRFSLEELAQLLRGWNGLYPEFRKAIYGTMGKIEQRAAGNKGYGWVTMANGERRWFLPGEDLHKGFNQRVQPSLAQFGIDWWLEVEHEMMRRFGDGVVPGVGRVGMVLMVHDSMVLLVPDDAYGVDAIEWAIQRGVDLWKERFPGVPGGVDAKPWSAHS